ncbi:MAG: hypothetical protein M3Z26_17405 [Bacteroidota bacterium]|nr:hypothetical protein [Bacteroidota bacterium]
MKKLLSIAISLIFLTFIFSCGKKDQPQTTAQKVQNKWTIVNIIDNTHDSSGDQRDTIVGTPGVDFFNFGANGSLTGHLMGGDANGNYSIVSNTQISINGQVFTINALTGSQFVLYGKNVVSTTEYDEETINMKR